MFTQKLKIVVLTLIAWTLFWEVKETITGERMNLFSRLYYSDMRYAKNIEVLTYLLTDEQVLSMFSQPNEPVQQLSEREIAELKVNMNVVLRVRNLKESRAFGRMIWETVGTFPNVVDIPYIPTPGNPLKYSDIIIPMGKIPMTRSDTPPDPITIRWVALYVK